MASETQAGLEEEAPSDPTATTPTVSPLPSHSKPCTLCSKPQDVLVRCQIDSSGSWHFVCPGRCWKGVSGGVIDGDEGHKYYRYGGMWKNKHDAVSAKKKKKTKSTKSSLRAEEEATEWKPPPDPWAKAKEKEKAAKYTRNDRVRWQGKEWICRRSHFSAEEKEPGKSWTWWKEID